MRLDVLLSEESVVYGRHRGCGLDFWDSNVYTDLGIGLWGPPSILSREYRELLRRT